MPLAQTEYVKALLTVYASKQEDLQVYARDGYPVPDPVLRLGGQCIVLRIVDPKNFGIGVYTVEGGAVQKKLFGNPLEHAMDDYKERVNRVVNKGLENLQVDN